MLKVEELKAAVQQLSGPDLSDFRAWYRVFDAQLRVGESEEAAGRRYGDLRDNGSSDDGVEREEDRIASEEKWEALFAQPEARSVMRQMAREARAEYRAGRTTEIAVTEDGRLAPA